MVVGVFNLWLLGVIFLIFVLLLLPKGTRDFLKYLFFSGGHAGLPITSITVNSDIKDILTAADPEDVTLSLDEETRRKFRTGWFREFFSSLWFRRFGTESILIVFVNKAATDFLPAMDNASSLKDTLFIARDDSRQLQVEQQQQEGYQGSVFSLLTGKVLSSSSTSSSSDELDESHRGPVFYVGGGGRQ
jgi:hypothetical protein